MHERYDADERRLLDSAASELWTDALLNAIVDVAPRIYEGASWAGGSPVDAPPRWAERSTAVLALASMALRTIRTLAMTVRSGYAPEALGDLRRLIEAAGHAQRVAEDTSGQYAENWLHGRGKAGKARAAFGSDRRTIRRGGFCLVSLMPSSPATRATRLSWTTSAGSST